MDFNTVISARITTRSYLPQQITEAQLEALLLAANTAPLAAGDRPTTMLIVVQSEETLSRLRAVCARKLSDGTTSDAFYGAPCVIFVAAADISDDHIEYCNAACIIENIMLMATSLKLGSTYIWGCLRKLRADSEALALLELPEGFEILSAVAVGSPTKPLEIGKMRKPLNIIRK